MKDLYLEPEIEIIRFEAMDIITTSSATSGNTNLDEDELPSWIIK